MNKVISILPDLKNRSWVLLGLFVVTSSIIFIGYSQIQFKSTLTKIFQDEQSHNVVLVQNLIKNHPLIEHAMVHGDRRKYLTALISLDQDNLRAWAEKNGYSDLDFEALTRLPEIREMVQKVVDESNNSLAKFETIKKFIIIPKPFLVDTGELTPTMKVRRSIVEDKYMDMLNALYNE